MTMRERPGSGRSGLDLCVGTLRVAVGVALAARSEVRSEETALDQYVAKPDTSYAWKVVKTVRQPGLTTFVVDLKSLRSLHMCFSDSFERK